MIELVLETNLPCSVDGNRMQGCMSHESSWYTQSAMLSATNTLRPRTVHALMTRRQRLPRVALKWSEG